MIVVCIKNTDDQCNICYSLTINKKYDAQLLGSKFEPLSANKKLYEVIDDDGVTRYYLKDWFMTVEGYRQQKLKELGI